jgi:hypothetical protein
MILDKWKDQNKIVINIGSKISLFYPLSDEINQNHPFAKQYCLDKYEQLTICKQHIKTTKYPMLMNVIPGFVLTDFSKKIHPSRGMKPETLAKIVFSNLEFIDEIIINELVIDCSIDPVIV